MSEYTNGYYIIGEVSHYEHYEWWITAAVYHPDLQSYFLYEDAGCSCNGPYEPDGYGGSWTPDSRPMGRRDLLEELAKQRNSYPEDQWTAEINELIQKVRLFKPEELTPDED